MLQNTNYQRNIIVNQSSSDILRALTYDIDMWWANLDSSPEAVGDIFKISFGGESYWKFMIKEISETHLIWKCVESNQDHNLKGIDEEWLNTEIEWRILEHPNETEIQFTHHGLVPDAICYEVCSNGWDFYILKSFQSYLDSGKGLPLGK
ncbi:MAG: hypothetical protein KJP00_07810 [Bacteroidia bacterium]|nr:hypothetical protein [Bacteroidia bacterium]